MIHTSRPVWQIAWPVIASNITIPLLGVIDTAMVGNAASIHDIAAVAIGSVFFDVLFWGFGFLRMSTTGLTAQNPHDKLIFFRSFTLALLLAASLIGLSPWLPQIAPLATHSAPTALKLKTYIAIRLWAAPGTLVNYVLLGYCFGRQHTKLAWLLLSISNLSAIFLDYLFVWHWHWQSPGIALSNVIAQTLGASIGFLILSRHFSLRLNALNLSQLLDKRALIQLFHLNKDILIRTLGLIATQAFFTYQSTKLGLNIIAANAILMHLQMLSAYGLDGFAIAAESLIGQAIGQNDALAFRNHLKQCAIWSLLTALTISLIYALAGTFYLSLMTSLPAVIQTARNYLIWPILLPVLSMPSFLLDGVYIGTMWSKPLRNAVLSASTFVFFPVWILSANWHNHGLWFAYACFITARGLYLANDLRRRFLKNLTH